MKLLINRFMLRHQGRLYKQGDCVDLPNDMAISLAEQSAGAYSLLPDVSESDTLEIQEVVSESDTKETLKPALTKSKPRAKTAKAGTSRTTGKTASSSRAKK